MVLKSLFVVFLSFFKTSDNYMFIHIYDSIKFLTIIVYCKKLKNVFLSIKNILILFSPFPYKNIRETVMKIFLKIASNLYNFSFSEFKNVLINIFTMNTKIQLIKLNTKVILNSVFV